MSHYHAVILGAGPAGSTVANLLAAAGRRVCVVEKTRFPRFHIGESLLPATVPLFERLGVHSRLVERFVKKPGGKWLYGDVEVPGDFAVSDGKATFQEMPYSYLVERADFDQILADQARMMGAEIRFETEVTDLLREGERVTGVRCRPLSGEEETITGDIVVDATGLRSFIPSKLRLRELTKPHRMGVYAQYAGLPNREDIKQGWFIGQMFFDGWTWLLRLPGERFSVGCVLTVDRFRMSGLSPESLLDRLMEENPLLRDGMTGRRERISDVMVTGNMGNSSTRLSGDGWVTAGDAAFFIDPCYSSGVHLAMASAEKVADRLLRLSPGEQPAASAFADYEREMRAHESAVHNMVDAFYIASRNTSVQKMVTGMQGGWLSRKFVTFVGGDFGSNAGFIRRVRWYSKIASWIFPNDSQRSPENHPGYLFGAGSSKKAESFNPGEAVYISERAA